MLAVLLTFVLTPVIGFLQRLRVPRTLAVIAAMLIAVTVIIGLGTMVANQVNQLATELPRYQTDIARKSAEPERAFRHARHVQECRGTIGVSTKIRVLLKECKP